MVAVANLSGVRLDLRALRAAIKFDGDPVKDADGKPVVSLDPLHPDLKRALGAKVRLLQPPAVNQGETATFPVVFPAFLRWTQIRFVDELNKIDVVVKNYAAMVENLGRVLEARKLAAKYERKRPKRLPEPDPGTKPGPPQDDYLLVGRVKNEVSVGRYGIELTHPKRVKGHKEFFIRVDGRTRAELIRIGSGTIAALATRTYRPKKGDAVYVRLRPQPPSQ
jgi:hypothetical protein